MLQIVPALMYDNLIAKYSNYVCTEVVLGRRSLAQSRGGSVWSENEPSSQQKSYQVLKTVK